MSDAGIFRLVYASRSLIEPADVEAEVARILAASRTNNPAAGITGALLFSADCFVQALEGPMAAVETVFERISLDPRHTDCIVLDAGVVEQREFAAWSMGYAGRRTDLRFAHLQASARGGQTLDLLRGALARLEEVPA